ncbi:hypothetical protein PE067_11275 [Paracoccus sp. DMF-8]|uniref:hypothetical protein n=1 Tax=Paracoccus sp. DMF-8 TaxID=3019445 RepID=UPI0023E8C114|nr:hypothetical protein [Paracoccus sp. DMF-8]MDF3606662.1 hypothetical protein [Paracoccus sp. DMF-8]
MAWIIATRPSAATKAAPAARSCTRPSSAVRGRVTRRIAACRLSEIWPADQISAWIASGGQMSKELSRGRAAAASRAQSAAMTAVGLPWRNPAPASACASAASPSATRNIGISSQPRWIAAISAMAPPSQPGPSARAELTRPPPPWPRPTRKPPASA